MSKESVEVSVVMAVYNGEDFLEESVESIRQQQDVVWELILVDDGSTDGTSNIARRLAKIDKRIHLTSQQNVGLTQALITGCKIASGEYIARQDVGDISLHGRLEKQAKALDDNDDWAFVSCLWETVGPEGETLSDLAPADSGKKIIHSLKSADMHDLSGPHHGSVMFRRSTYKACGGYRSQFYFAQDLDLWTRLIEVGDLGFVQEPLYQSLFTQQGISATYGKEQAQLKSLVSAAMQARRLFESEDEFLEQAKIIGPQSLRKTTMTNESADYFIGSCLFDRRDYRARRYLKSAVKIQPLHWKAWIKLMASFLVHRSGRKQSEHQGGC